MRCLVKVRIPNDGANQMITSGKFGDTMKSILSTLKPESCYFVTEDGERTGYIFMDIPDPSHIVRIAEPFFLAFNARVDCSPAMTAEDLGKAKSDMDAAAKTYGGIRQPAMAR